MWHRGRDHSFDTVEEVAVVIEQVSAAIAPPRGVAWLLDLAGEVGCQQGATVLDAGGWAGQWARQLEDRYGCSTVVCDLAASAVSQARAIGTCAVMADVQDLPFRSGEFDVVWCRDVLSMVPDPARMLAETYRVLKPGGGLMLYTALPTARLEPVERRELFAGVGAPDWWGEGAGFVRELLIGAGFVLMSETRTSPEHTEANLEAGGDLVKDWVTLARLEREPQLFRDAIGDEWYRRWLDWTRWSIYLLLGKLETIAWTARTPR